MKTQTEIDKLFFAYQCTKEGYCDSNVEAIRRALNDYNSHQKSINAITWEDLKKSGSFINTEILKNIEESAYFACDLTALNHNVLFELGYAMAKNKNIFIFLNEDIEGAKEKYQDFILKNIKYTSFKSSKEILAALQNKEYSQEHLKDATTPEILLEENDIFYLENEYKSQTALDLNEFINSIDKAKVKINDPLEVDYKTLSYYFSNLQNAKCILFHMLPNNYYNNPFLENGKYSFLAGVACGLDKKVLLIAPAKFKSPLDYADILIDYVSSDDCISKVHNWLTNNLLKTENHEIPSVVTKPETSDINILKIALECTAENEKEDLYNYFISTNAYEKAQNIKSKLLLIGRKGAGKTAIYFKLLEDLSDDNLNYNINLKPDSLELLENIDMSQLYKSGSSQKTFFYTVWKTVIYSKLIQLLKQKVLLKQEQNSILTDVETEIIDFCIKNASLIKQNFFGIIKELSEKAVSEKIDSPQILEGLYNKYLSPLTNLIKRYFENKKYIKLNVLSDNLDKSWNPQSDLNLQSNMILTLLEVDSQIKNDLSNEKKDNISVFNYIFLREDIYNYISNKANEPDKLKTISYKINWEDYPLKLKELVELKLNHILNRSTTGSMQDIWDELFNIPCKTSVFDTIKDVIVLRPRDILFFIQSLFESAANYNHAKVEKSDFEYAVNQYTEFLNGNLIAEMKAEYVCIADILTLFQSYQELRYKDYCTKLKSKFGYDEEQIKRLTIALFKNNYLTAFDKTIGQNCLSYAELEEALTKRIWFCFKHNIVLYVNSQYKRKTNISSLQRIFKV